MAKCGVLGNLLAKEHTHTFVNAGGDVRALDFRFTLGGRKIGAPFHGLKAFFTTGQLAPVDKARAAPPAPRPRRGGRSARAGALRTVALVARVCDVMGHWPTAWPMPVEGPAHVRLYGTAGVSAARVQH
jgi:hypothetical protein